MTFFDLPLSAQQEIVQLLNNHIAVSADILLKDRCLIPMLMLPDTKQLMALHGEDGPVDYDKCHNLAIRVLKDKNFTYALFSYSTRVALSSGKQTDALKTCIFTGDGIEISFYSPYRIKGLFKKTIDLRKPIIGELRENVFA